MTTIRLGRSTLTFSHPVAAFMHALASIVFERMESWAGRQRLMTPKKYGAFMGKVVNEVAEAFQAADAGCRCNH